MNNEPLVIDGLTVKFNFKYYFEDIDTIPKVKLISICNNNLDLNKILIMSKSIRFNDLSDNCIKMLYSFDAGVQFLFLHQKELYYRHLLMYMFSSPFIKEEQLLEMLHDPFIIENCDDTFLDYFANNPNIYQMISA